MDSLGTISVCEKCLREVCVGLCSVCGKSPVRMSPLLLATFRVLRAKGWVVKQWSVIDEVTNGYIVGLRFFLFAPPPVVPIVPDVKSMEPWVLSGEQWVGISIAYGQLYKWARQAPIFVVPFAQDFCDLCKQQGADWHFSRCRCPVGKGMFHRFADGYPEKCAYAVEQVLTFQNRLDQLSRMGYFDFSRIARRMCNRQLKKEGTI